MKSSITGLTDENGCPRVFLATATQGKDITLLWVNDSEHPANVSLTGIAPDTRLRQWWVGDRSYNRINKAHDITTSAQTAIELKPRSITVFTTYDYGSELVGS